MTDFRTLSETLEAHPECPLRFEFLHNGCVLAAPPSDCPKTVTIRDLGKAIASTSKCRSAWRT